MKSIQSKLKTFSYVFRRSLSDISYYKDIITAPLSFSFKYLYFLMFIVVLAATLRFAISLFMLLPQVPQFVNTASSMVTNAYPKELEFSVKNGILTTNVDEPYYIESPIILKEIRKEYPHYEHFITIDTTAKIDDYKNYQTVVLVTQKAFVYPDDNENDDMPTLKVTEFDPQDEPFTFNRAKYDEFIKKVLPILNYTSQIVIAVAIGSVFLFPAVGGLLLMAWNLFYLLLVTVIVWIVTKVLKHDFSYGKVYQFGMHGLTLPMLITTIMFELGVHIPFLFTAIFLLWMVVIFAKLPQAEKKAELKS